MGLALETIAYYDNSGGLNLKSSPTKVPEDESSLSQNIDYTTDGALGTRNGSKITNITAGIPAQMPGAPKTLNLFDYKNSRNEAAQISTVGTTIKHSLVTPVNQVTGLSAALPYPDMESFVTNDDEYAIWGNGIDTNLKFNGTIYTNLSLPVPIAPTFAADSAGVLPNGTYEYFVTFARTVSGVIVQESAPSPIGTHVLAAGPNTINLIVPIATEVTLPGVSAQVNGRVIYRALQSTDVFHRVTPGVTIADNVTTAYADNTPDPTIDNYVISDPINSPVATPKSKVFEEYLGRMFYVDAANSTDVYYTPIPQPWSVFQDPILFDGPVRCIKRVFGALIFGTDRSIWVLNGDILTNSPRRVSSAIGILNNRCAVAQDSGVLYILATNKKVFRLSPTDFSQDEIRFSDPLSQGIDPLFAQITVTDPEIPCMVSFTPPNISKVEIYVPVGGISNNTTIVYNESESLVKQKPCWQVFNNWKVSAVSQFTINGAITLNSGDYNGFFWRLEDPSLSGDGAEINGTVTSSTVNTLTELLLAGTATSGTITTLTDSALTMTVNAFSGYFLAITAGTGVGQTSQILSNTTTTFSVISFPIAPDATSVFTVGPFRPGALVGIVTRILSLNGVDQARVVTSNTNTTLTIGVNWSVNPIALSEYTVGGFDAFHFSNWKAVVESYDVLKQLWFIWVNANASGNYTIQLIIQTDFDQTTTNQTVALLNLRAGNAIWGEVTWGEFIWGAFAVFEDRLRIFNRFRSIRLGFMNRKAGQPFQINGFSISVQNKKLFFRSIA